MAIVWSRQDPAYPEPTHPHCEICLKWLPEDGLCAACDREVHRDITSEVQP